MERSAQRLGRALVVIVDDRAAHGEHEDTAGPLVTELLEEAGFIVDGVVVVHGETVAIRNALNTAVIGGVDLVITVGGTGVLPRDVTPMPRRACSTVRSPASARPCVRPGSPPEPWTRASRAGSSASRAARSW